ncbi:KAP family P-loop NTPase fold protein [Qipengyuania flava]|uniref:KAP family P-loop NTPase fold protein n=1 Tax=Qipengyuania flava TaxID=192812 RepID=UPI001C62C110|nr:P-loop NTPase fold protein [Qipengyuania flava]QYJ06466.1 KAP family NTPase [Qipengyuania flava]
MNSIDRDAKKIEYRESAEVSMRSWNEDLFERRQLAQDLIAYCKTVSRHGTLLDGDRSLVVAVDADYGIGKSFFLRGLELELEGGNPVAFIDAWSGDLLDDPLTAIASVLKRSIGSQIAKDDKVKAKWLEFASKAGRVMIIGGKGALKRGAQLAVTQGAVEGISQVLSGASEGVMDDVEDAIDDAVKDSIEEFDRELKAIDSNKIISARITEFESGVRAIEDMKRSLAALVASLSEGSDGKSIFIIVDELDRCRPSYAIKFLEEIRHLFGVPGVVFILGVNSDQLGKAVSGLYGNRFDGGAYLQRFIDRRINLPFPPLTALVQKLFSRLQDGECLAFPKINDANRREIGRDQYISSLLSFYNVSPRDVFKFFDMLQTSIAILRNDDIEAIHLTETICRNIVGEDRAEGRNWSFGFGNSIRQFKWVEADSVIRVLGDIYRHSDRDAMRVAGDSEDPMYEYISWFLGKTNLRASPTNYPNLLNDVAALTGED